MNDFRASREDLQSEFTGAIPNENISKSQLKRKRIYYIPECVKGGPQTGNNSIQRPIVFESTYSVI